MKETKRFALFFCSIVLGLAIIGCNESSSSSSPTTSTKTGLFKTAGTFSFSSNKGNFLAEGVFDTSFVNTMGTSASGAFKYTEGTRNIVMVMAYNIVSPTNVQIAFAAVYDSTATIANGASYSFAGTTGAKIALFGYIPNAADTSSTIFLLTKGSFNVSTLSATAISGSFSGSGFSVMDTTITFTLTNGTCNTPIVETYYDMGFDDSMNKISLEKRMKSFVKKEFHLQ